MDFLSSLVLKLRCVLFQYLCRIAITARISIRRLFRILVTSVIVWGIATAVKTEGNLLNMQNLINPLLVSVPNSDA